MAPSQNEMVFEQDSENFPNEFEFLDIKTMLEGLYSDDNKDIPKLIPKQKRLRAHPPTHRQKWINKLLKEAPSFGDLVAVIDRMQPQQVDCVNISTAMNCLAKRWPDYPLDQTLAISTKTSLFKLLQCAATLVSTFDAQGVSNCVHAIAKITNKDPTLMYSLRRDGFGPDHVLNLMARRAMDPDVLNRFVSQEVTNVVWAFATLGIEHRPLLRCATARALEPTVLSSFAPQDIANTSWAVAKLGFEHRELMHALAHRACSPEVLLRFIPQEIANTVWAFAKLGLKNPLLFESMAKRAQEPGVLQKFNSQEIANLCWALAKLNIEQPSLMNALADHALSPKVILNFKPQEIASTIWAFGKLGVDHRELINALSMRAHEHRVLSRLNSQGISNIIWAFAKLRINYPQLIQALIHQAMLPDILSQFKAQEIANLTWALTTLNVDDTRLLDVLNAQGGGQNNLTTRACVPSVTLTSEELDGDANDFARFVIDNPEALNLLATRSDLVDKLTPTQLSSTIFALARLGIQHSLLLSCLTRRAAVHNILQSFTPQELTSLLWSCAKLAIRDDEIVMAVMNQMANSNDIIESLSSQDVAVALWSQAVLGVEHQVLNLLLVSRIFFFYSKWTLSASMASDILWSLAVLDLCDQQMATALAQCALSGGLKCVIQAAWSLSVLEFSNEPIMKSLVDCIFSSNLANLDKNTCCLLHQVLVELKFTDPSRLVGLKNSQESVLDTCAMAFREMNSIDMKGVNTQVSSILRAMGLSVSEDVCIRTAGQYCVRIMCEGILIVEVDGPTHFIRTTNGFRPSGGDRLKHRHLKAFGYEIIHLASETWQSLQNIQVAQTLLAKMIRNIIPEFSIHTITRPPPPPMATTSPKLNDNQARSVIYPPPPTPIQVNQPSTTTYLKSPILGLPFTNFTNFGDYY